MDLTKILAAVIILSVAFLRPEQSCAQAVADTVRTVARDKVTAGKARTATSAQKTQVTTTVHVNEDSLAFALKPHPYQPNPKKSGLYSAILPGLGQAYNHQYWKVPVVYVGLGIGAYVITTNRNKYYGYRRSYIGSSDPYYSDDNTKAYSTDQLKQLQDDYYKYLELSVLFTGLGYFLQVVDAITSAHLKNFDISRDISMHMAPVMMPGNAVGLGLVVNWK